MVYSHLLWICLLMVSMVHSEELCVKKTPCSCEFQNGSTIDLAPSANTVHATSKIYQESRDGARTQFFTYYFHPCHDVKMNNISDVRNVTNYCTGPAALCRHRSLWNKTAPYTLNHIEESYNFLGTSNDADIGPDGKYITFYNRPSRTVVHLICADTDDRLDVMDLSEDSIIKLRFFSRNACLRAEAGGAPILYGAPAPAPDPRAHGGLLMWPLPPTSNQQPIKWGLFQVNLRNYNIF